MRFLIRCKRSIDSWILDPSTLLSNWSRKCWLTNKWIEVEVGNSSGHSIAGVCEGIDREGALMVKDENESFIICEVVPSKSELEISKDRFEG